VNQIKNLLALTIAVLLLVSGLSCNALTTLLGEETPVAPTEVPTEQPTEPAIREMTPLDYPFGGLRLEYPAGWVMGYERRGIILAESQDVLDSMDWASGAAMATMSGSLEDISNQIGTGVDSRTAEELLQAVLDQLGAGGATPIETRRFATQQGAGAPIQLTADPSTRGYVATYMDQDIAVVILVIGPSSRWDAIWPLMDATMSTMVFYPPVGSIIRGPIGPDRTETATLDPGGFDGWTYTSSGNEYVTIEITALGDWDPTLEVFGPNGESIGYNDDSSSLNPALTDLYLLTGGDYEIRIGAFSGNGGYEVRLSSAAPGGGTIAYGETVEDELAQGDRDSWTFAGTAGDQVTISMEGVGSLTDTYLELYGPDGNELIRDDDSGEGFFALIENFTLPETGSYRIVARAFGGGSGPYRLILRLSGTGGTATEPPPGTRIIAYGQTLSGELTTAEPRQNWFFEGTAGDRVTISMIGLGSLNDTYLELYGPNDAEVARNDDGGEGLFALIEDFTLPETGTYRILARGFAGATGQYELTLTRR